MKIAIILLSLLFTSAIFAQTDKGFSLEGKTTGIANGSTLLLQDPLYYTFIDTIVVSNNEFKTNIKLPSFPYKVVLFKDGSTAATIWAEDNPMTFNSQSGDFSDAVITGSHTNDLFVELRTESRKLTSYEAKVGLELEFIANNPDNMLSINNLSLMMTAFGKAKTLELFEKMPASNKQSAYGKIVSEFLGTAVSQMPVIGEKYANIQMEDQEGTTHELYEFEGEVFLIDFWASWCAPCRKAHPELVKLYMQFRDKKFEIVSISLDDDKKSWTEAIKKDGLIWTHLSDLKGRDNIAALRYAVKEIPFNVLVGKDGKIIAVNVSTQALREKLNAIYGL